MPHTFYNDEGVLKNYYDILKIPPFSSSTEVRQAYYKLIFEYHPDKNLGKEKEAETKSREIIEAYKTLVDPDSRAEYEREYIKKYRKDDLTPNQKGSVSDSFIPTTDPIRKYFKLPNLSEIPDVYSLKEFLKALYKQGDEVNIVYIISSIAYDYNLFTKFVKSISSFTLLVDLCNEINKNLDFYLAHTFLKNIVRYQPSDEDPPYLRDLLKRFVNLDMRFPEAGFISDIIKILASLSSDNREVPTANVDRSVVVSSSSPIFSKTNLFHMFFGERTNVLLLLIQIAKDRKEDRDYITKISDSIIANPSIIRICIKNVDVLREFFDILPTTLVIDKFKDFFKSKINLPLLLNIINQNADFSEIGNILGKSALIDDLYLAVLQDNENPSKFSSSNPLELPERFIAQYILFTEGSRVIGNQQLFTVVFPNLQTLSKVVKSLKSTENQSLLCQFVFGKRENYARFIVDDASLIIALIYFEQYDHLLLNPDFGYARFITNLDSFMLIRKNPYLKEPTKNIITNHLVLSGQISSFLPDFNSLLQIMEVLTPIENELLVNWLIDNNKITEIIGNYNELYHLISQNIFFFTTYDRLIRAFIRTKQLGSFITKLYELENLMHFVTIPATRYELIDLLIKEKKITIIAPTAQDFLYILNTFLDPALAGSLFNYNEVLYFYFNEIPDIKLLLNGTFQIPVSVEVFVVTIITKTPQNFLSFFQNLSDLSSLHGKLSDDNIRKVLTQTYPNTNNSMILRVIPDTIGLIYALNLFNRHQADIMMCVASNPCEFNRYFITKDNVLNVLTNLITIQAKMILLEYLDRNKSQLPVFFHAEDLNNLLPYLNHSPELTAMASSLCKPSSVPPPVAIRMDVSFP